MTDDTQPDDPGHIGTFAASRIEAPKLPYEPRRPKTYRPRIGVIGTGGISHSHLDAYRTEGWEVAALWNRTRATAEARAAAYCPEARIADRWEDILEDPSIDVVDITPHPDVRVPMVEAALRAGKHVLSQKPFVTDLRKGERLVAIADDHGVRLAVNQNGRWAPHMSWMREAVRAGLIGELMSCHLNLHWDHTWVAGTSFEQLDGLVLNDMAVHWFDFLVSLAGGRLTSVYAMETRAAGQVPPAPLLAQVLVRMDGGQASLVFDGATTQGRRDTTFMTGTLGCLQSDGPDLQHQDVTLTTAAGIASPSLTGSWFNDGFRGTMGALLCAIEDGREPENSARGNLRSLAASFAAMASARERREVLIGDVVDMAGTRA